MLRYERVVMGDVERLHKIKYMIQARQCVPLDDFLSELEISKATFKRDLEYLRSRMNASIVYDRFKGGYCFDGQSIGEKIELPGLWFSEKEATALVLMQHLLSGLDKGGLIAPHIAPLTSIIDGILGQSNTPAKELRKRLKVFGMSARKSSIENFEEIGSALLNRKRLQIAYYARGTNETTEKQLHEHFAESYGIFSGKADQRAKLKFNPEKARWVSSETWHGQQVGSFDKEGNYLLEFDYNQDPELVMDILKYGSGVEVLAPASLRKRIKEELSKALNKY